jgi:hypothetical protein
MKRNLLVLDDKGLVLGQIVDPFLSFDEWEKLSEQGKHDSDVQNEIIWSGIYKAFPSAVMLAEMVLTLRK